MRVLVVEPFFGGSHARLVDGLVQGLPFDVVPLTLPARHWKWRMRTAAIPLARAAADLDDPSCDAVIASAFLDLPAFRALAPPAIGQAPTALYFHENQIAYPVRDERERDLHYAMTNVMSALTADACLFNSDWNRRSFLDGIPRLMSIVEDPPMPGIADAISSRSSILPVPIDTRLDVACRDPRPPGPPLVVWNHRWEHDKDPEAFFDALFDVAERGTPFRVAVCGQRYSKWPSVFDDARARLGDHIDVWGPLEARDDYLAVLRRASVVVSTARHEFQGLSVLEAALAGARPLLPRRLSYPELFPDDALYSEGELADRLDALLRTDIRTPDPVMIEHAERLTWSSLSPLWIAEIEELVKSGRLADR